MTDYSDVIGRSLTFAVFSDNRELAKKADYTLSLVNGNIKRKSK